MRHSLREAFMGVAAFAATAALLSDMGQGTPLGPVLAGGGALAGQFFLAADGFSNMFARERSGLSRTLSGLSAATLPATLLMMAGINDLGALAIPIFGFGASGTLNTLAVATQKLRFGA